MNTEPTSVPLQSTDPAPPTSPRPRFWHWELGRGRATVCALVPARPAGLLSIPFGVSLASPADCSKGFSRELGRKISEGRARAAAERRSAGSGPVKGRFLGIIDEADRLSNVPCLAMELLFWAQQSPSWARSALRQLCTVE